MTELQELTPTDVVPYKRGISPLSAFRATLGRFLPGSLLGLGSVFAMVNSAMPAGQFVLVGLSFVVAPLLIGFGLGLEGLRRWLYPDAEIEGRRSFIAGIMASAVASTLALIPFASAGAYMTVVFLVGLVTAVLMFFAWLTPTPELDAEDEEVLALLGEEAV